MSLLLLLVYLYIDRVPSVSGRVSSRVRVRVRVSGRVSSRVRVSVSGSIIISVCRHRDIEA